ncbi:MAG: class I SAM-dependent methyltransferase [Candidatus Levyibacteriota bacterium]
MAKSSTWDLFKKTDIPSSLVLSEDTIKKYLSEAKTVVDLGCGFGKNTLLLAHYFTHVIGIDISQNSIHYAKQCVAKERLKNVAFQIDDVELLQTISTNSADGVVAIALFTTLAHKNPIKELAIQLNTFETMNRILKLNGIIILQDFLLNPRTKLYKERYRKGLAQGYRFGTFFVERDNSSYLAHHFNGSKKLNELIEMANLTGFIVIKEKQSKALSRSGNSVNEVFLVLKKNTQIDKETMVYSQKKQLLIQKLLTFKSSLNKLSAALE